MSRMTCFDSNRALHDRRLRRKLTGWEFRDFFLMLCFASDECRDPAFIPPKKVPDLRLELGFNEEALARRLAKWSADGIELIRVEDDGGIRLLYLYENQDEGDFVEDGQPQNGGRNGLGSGYGVQAGRRYSSSPGAARARDFYNRRKNGSENGSEGENLTPAESKPNGYSSGFEPHGDQKPNALPGANSNGNSNGDSNAGFSSRDENVQRSGLNFKNNLNQDSTLNVLGQKPNAEPNGQKPNAPHSSAGYSSAGHSSAGYSSAGHPPPNLPALVLARRAVVIAGELNDAGSENRHYQLLQICDRHNLSDLVEQSLHAVQRRRDNPRRGPIEKPGAYYSDILVKKLSEHGVQVPTKEQLAAEPAEDVRRLIQESMATGAGVITPLNEVYTEEAEE